MQWSVVIPALNEEENIARAINSALAAGADEVIVVDGGSRDRTREIARMRDCRVLERPRGRAMQQNAGAAAARGDVLLFLHADNWLEPAVGDQLRAAFADERAQAGAFEQRIEAVGAIWRLLEKGNTARARHFGRPYGDQGIFLRRELFDRLGGFPQVKLMEDVLLMRAVRRITRPILLPGPIHVSPRRWLNRGVILQTLLNWSLLAAAKLGVHPDRLARYYRPCVLV